MKPVLNWIKANLVAVICVVVVLIALPVAWFFSSGWNKSIKTSREAEVGREMQAITQARVDYTLPSYEPGVEPVSLSTEPNDALTRWFKARRDEIKSEADALVQRIIAFNKGEGPDAQAVGRRPHAPLIEGLFPAPQGDPTERFYEMEDALLGKRGRTDPYEALLRRINAGGPPEPQRVAEAVENVRARELEKIGPARQATAEEAAEIQKKLVERRIAEYQARARDISVYASTDAFESDQKKGAAIPTEQLVGLYSREPARLRPMRFFLWQWDLWTYTDLLEAVRIANTGPGNRPLNVVQAPVKRIEYVSAREVEGVFEDSSTPDPMGGMGMGEPAAPTPAVPATLVTDPTRSVTGRASGEWNTLYDVRRADMRLIVDSKRVDEVIRAFSATNLMTVLDMDIEQIDVWEHLREGYYYGPDHVVRLNLNIETLWLRPWTTRLMPEILRNAMGVASETDPNAANPG